jgi:hypothetical protein
MSAGFFMRADFVAPTFASERRPHLTSRCSRRRAVVLPSFHMTKTLQPAAKRALARSS